MEKSKVIKQVKTTESRNGKYKDYNAEANHEQQYYLELTKKSESFKACSPRQRFFIINYVLCGGNASRAMVLSGTTSKYYAQTAAKWMKEDRIQNAIHEFWEIVFGDKIDKIERNLIDALYRRAFTNRWQYFNKDGSLKDSIQSLEALGEDHIIIDGIETKFYGKDADREVTIYKLADRDSAFKQLQSMLGLDNKNINLRTDSGDNKSTGVLAVPGMLEADEWEELTDK